MWLPNWCATIPKLSIFGWVNTCYNLLCDMQTVETGGIQSSLYLRASLTHSDPRNKVSGVSRLYRVYVWLGLFWLEAVKAENSHST